MCGSMKSVRLQKAKRVLKREKCCYISVFAGPGVDPGRLADAGATTPEAPRPPQGLEPEDWVEAATRRPGDTGAVQGQ